MEKFFKTRELFARHLLPGETSPEPPKNNPVIAIAPIEVTECAPMFANLGNGFKAVSPETLTVAVAEIPKKLATRSGDLRQRITVEEWNGRPVTTSAGKALLESAGFVRHYPPMTLYAPR